MVTELPDSTKGGAKGLVAVWGGWAGLSQHPSRPFSPNYTLKIPGATLWIGWKRRPLPASANYSNRSQGEGLQNIAFARNLTEVVREPQEYVINILPRKLAKDEIVPGEHYTVKELPLYQEAKEADAERRRKLLEDRDQKKLKALSGRLPDRSGVRTSSKENSGKRGKLVKKHGKDRPRTHVGVESSGPSLVAAARLANVAEEAASINRPGNLNPDADAAETAPLEEAGAESQKRQQEIEISCASAHDAHPDGGEVEMATETSAAPAIIPAEDASGPMCPDEDMGVRFRDKSYPLLPHLRRNLLTMPLLLALSATRSWKLTGEGPPQHVSTTRSFYSAAADCRLYEDLLLSAQEIENQLREGREESTAGRLHEAEGEAARLRDELSQLRTEVLNEKKQKEDLQLRLDVQKEELEREFAVEREELAADYQQQVDDTFIFGYRCCMKKNGT
ncbi:hypothetical protein CK203_058860 [Vitis vinifera]|uniref:Uncharacterized protein n=1 Tax=Vitis vinifera TaxID=29760 RepID=A0A438G8T2_VITVI|nr:hypothetical protein CK203_058860 [Vitis vinifera]